MILWGQCCYPHFAEGKTEAQSALVGFEPSQSGCGARVLNCCPDNCGQALCYCKAPHVLKMRPALSQYLSLSAQPVGSGLAAPCPGCQGLGGWRWGGCCSAPSSGKMRTGCSRRKPGLHSLVEQEQLLMTFRKKLMMRNASWHFRSASQQPCISAHRRGEGRGLGMGGERGDSRN